MDPILEGPARIQSSHLGDYGSGPDRKGMLWRWS